MGKRVAERVSRETTRSHRKRSKTGGGISAFVLLHCPSCFDQSRCESTWVLRSVELSVDGAENLKLFVFVKTCSGAPIWIEDAIPMHIGWTFCRPPTEGSMVETPDCEQVVPAALQVVVVEHSRAIWC